MEIIHRFKYIVIRREYKECEYRVALTPNDCKKLTGVVYVEKSIIRCFTDLEYSDVGCILIDNYLNLTHPVQDMLIVGLKDLPINSRHYIYNHLYFSHSFKNQRNSKNILQLFKSNGGNIYDLEYFTDKNRLFTFGFYSGIVGCYLGLLQYYYRRQLKNICNLTPFNTFKDLFNKISIEKELIYVQPTIAIIGNGRSATGCISLLNSLDLSYKTYNRSMSKHDLNNYNIIINCILLTDKIEPFITTDTLHKFVETEVVVDISCDYNNINNPLPIYKTATTFQTPLHAIHNFDLIAIDNLPSLLPKDSSLDFSNKLVNFINNNDMLWKNNLSIFKNKINNL